MTGMAPKLLIWRLLIGGLLLLAFWRVIVLGLAEHYAMGLGSGTPDAAEKVLAWNPDHPRALAEAALLALASDPVRAIELARKASAADPGNALPLALLARAYLARGEADMADAFADRAREMMPTRVPPLIQLVEYWGERQRLDRALDLLSTVLTADPGLGESYYPRLLALVEDTSILPAFRPLTQQPPPWWDAFFAQVAKRAVKAETVSLLTAMRGESTVPLSEQERDAAVSRLLRDGDWPAAYLMWINGLNAEQRLSLGNVYNGNFELEMDGKGFNWGVRTARGVRITRQKTFGIRGEKALHLMFDGTEFRFEHLYQPLFLAPGDYEFSVEARPDRLQGRGGLRWSVYCINEDGTLLGQSKRLLGTSEWRRESFPFTVPASACAGQTLRLESEGKRLFDHKLSGEAWFDQAVVRRSRQDDG